MQDLPFGKSAIYEVSDPPTWEPLKSVVVLL
jgi:hypothetical protein